MTEVHVGRLVAASLHQAIGDELPQRLDYYEDWLAPERLRDGGIGIAPLSAVLGFLRTEGEGYDRVVRRAGVLAAEWALMSRSRLSHRLMAWLPRRWRVRAALRVAAEIAEEAGGRSKVAVRGRGTAARLVVTQSIFCAARGVQAAPLCGFYSALAVTTLAHFGLASVAHIEQCRAMGAETCTIEVSLHAAQPTAETAVAA